MDFNAQIDLTKLSGMPLDLSDDTPFDDTPVPKKRGRPTKAEAQARLEAANMERVNKPKKPKPSKEQIPKYIPKPITKAKRKATPGAIKKGEYRGIEALSAEDKAFIEENARKISVDDIADQIGKRRISVRKYMERHGLLGEEDKRNASVKKAILNELHNQAFWRIIKKGYSPEEIEYFEESWYVTVLQLDDNITPTEREQLRQLIETQVSIDRITIRERQTLDAELKIEEQLQILEDKLWRVNESGDDDEVLEIRSQIEKLTTNKLTIASSKNYIDRTKENLVKTHGKLMDSLDVTRTKRVEQFDTSGRTWAKMLLQIKDDPRLKRQKSAMAYISFLAVERMRAKLTKNYTYADGDNHPPMMLPEGVVNPELGELVELMYVPKVENA